MPSYAAIVLAAGESSRMGELKQLLPWNGSTFVGHIVRTLRRAPVDEIVVVLGHRAEDVGAQLPVDGTPPVRAVFNAAYKEGMLSSLQCGVRALPPQTRAAFIVLCDQPQMRAETLSRLRSEMERTGAGIAVPSHRMRRGHPLLIDMQKYRSEILALNGPPGLQRLLRDHSDDILHVPFDDADVLADLDTPQDYARATASRGSADRQSRTE